MSRRIKRLVVGLLLLVLPVQGVLAATMVACVVAANEAPAVFEYHANHHHDGASGHEDHAPTDDVAYDDSGCAGCIPCCMGASITADVSVISPLFPHDNEQPPFQANAFLGFTPSRLDRPPRYLPV